MLPKGVELANEALVCHCQHPCICHRATARMAKFRLQLRVAILIFLIRTPNVQPLIDDCALNTEARIASILQTLRRSAIATIPYFVQSSVLLVWLNGALNVSWKAKLKNHHFDTSRDLRQSYAARSRIRSALLGLAEELFDATNGSRFDIISNCMNLENPCVEESST